MDESELRSEFKRLDAEIKSLEKKMKAIVDELNQTPANGSEPVGLHGSLVDEVGAPRDDIDIWHIRELRHQFACYRTDLKELNAKMEQVMKDLFKVMRENGKQSNTPATTESKETGTTEKLHPTVRPPPSIRYAPFLLVDEVLPNSIAESIGLKVNDSIIHFGRVDSTNFKSLSEIVAELNSHRGKTISIEVERRAEDKTIKQVSISASIPEDQSIRFGCHLIPL